MRQGGRTAIREFNSRIREAKKSCMVRCNILHSIMENPLKL